MGFLEIQVLAADRSARRTVGAFPQWCESVHIGAGNVVYVRPDVASSLDDVAGLTPLVISLRHLLGVPYDSALGQEHFDVSIRSAEFTDPAEDPCDVIELRSGEMALSALLPHNGVWPHVMLHRALPRGHSFATLFTSTIERAFLAALRDAVRGRVREPADPAA